MYTSFISEHTFFILVFYSLSFFSISNVIWYLFSSPFIWHYIYRFVVLTFQSRNVEDRKGRLCDKLDKRHRNSSDTQKQILSTFLDIACKFSVLLYYTMLSNDINKWFCISSWVLRLLKVGLSFIIFVFSVPDI